MQQRNHYNNLRVDNQLPWLDLVRFVAAFVVLIGHYRASAFVEYGLLPDDNKNIFTQMFYFMTRMGGEAVLVFFVLSGYFIMGRGIVKCQQEIFDIKKYTVDRVARIMLPLVSALLLLVIVNYVYGIGFSWLTILGNLFSLQGVLCGPAIGPLWSLSYEVWFYILFGAFAWLLTANSVNRSRIISCRGGCFCLLIIVLAFMVFTKLSPHYLFIWCMGGLAYYVRPHKKSRLILYASFIGIVMMTLLMQISKESRSMESFVCIDMRLIEIGLAVFCCLFIRQLCLFPPKCKLAVKISRLGTYLARFSYTLYLTHQTIFIILEQLGVPKSQEINIQSIGLYVAELVIALIAAYAIYLLFESRTNVVKRHLMTLCK